MANSEKLENLLNVSLNVTKEERAESNELEVGYTPEDNTWELIVLYNGDIANIKREFPDIMVERLSGNYAILQVPESQIDALTQNPQIEYVEKPKNLVFAVREGSIQSCIPQVKREPYSLSGLNTIVAVIDSGIDYFHPDFRNADGTTRILDIWDQSAVPREGENPPAPYQRGVEYSREQINRALAESNPSIVPMTDTSGHGTHVTGIAAGNGRASNGQYEGVAYQSELLIVKLGATRNSFPRTTELMLAVDYVVNKAIEYGRPLAVNISIGNNYGSHSGNSLLETYLNMMAGYGRTVICVGSGNEGATRGHTSGRLENGIEQIVELGIDAFQTSMSVQIWKNYEDMWDVIVTTPSGRRIGPIPESAEVVRYETENTRLLFYYGEPSPYSPYQEIYLSFLPTRDYIERGIWTFTLVPRRIVTGEYHLWLPSAATLSVGTGFLYPAVDTTLTIPSTASKIITVGAYDSFRIQIVDFSGRGYTRETNQVKPDIVAPGVNIISCAPGGGYVAATGTSMATPFVTGSTALLMEWGIVNGNDPYLYGEKMKAYLRRGARELPGISTYPNPKTGWGRLCVADSIPRG